MIYGIVSDNSIAGLTTTVQAFIVMGWQPQGGPMFSFGSNPEGSFHQAVMFPRGTNPAIPTQLAEKITL